MADHTPQPDPDTAELQGDAEEVTDPADQSGEKAAEGTPWWADPRMPWSGQPTRADMWCWALIAFLGIFAIAMLPLRPVLLGYTPYLLVALTGSRTGMVTIGALGATGDPWWPAGLVIGIISIIKFDFIYFWAGKLWGRGLFDVIVGDSPRAQRNAARAEKLALKYSALAVLVTYIPIPFPRAVVFATVAMAGMTWKRFALVNLTGAVVIQSIWLVLGWQLGATAVHAVEVFARYSLWVSGAILIAMFVAAWWRGREKAAAADAEQ